MRARFAFLLSALGSWPLYRIPRSPEGLHASPSESEGSKARDVLIR